jgi:hypothetical protein
MVKGKSVQRYRETFRGCREIRDVEVGRPKLHNLRSNPIVSGTLEYLVQPIYDFYGVAVATVVTKQQLFSTPIGSQYTPAGGSAYTKTLYHTNLVQQGMLDAPKKFLVKNVSVVVRSDIAPQDLASFIGQTLAQLTISGKDYWTALVSKCPAGAGSYGSATVTIAATSAGSVANNFSNGWPSAENASYITDPMPQIPNLPDMAPILGQLIEQNQNFGVVLDPTLTGSTAFTTLATTPTTLFVGNGINAHVYLEGVLCRAVL